MFNNRMRRFAAGFAALFFILFVGACSSDSKSSDAKSSDSFKIGLEAPLSGSQAQLGTGMLQGAQLAAEELNAKGGILGKQVEIVPIDDQADPTAGVTAATAAVKKGLNAVVGPYNSGVGSKTLPIYIDAGLVPLRLTSADSTASLGFTLQPMTSQIAPVAVTAIQKYANATSVALIVDSTQEYTKQASDAMQKLLPSSGITVTSVESITPGAQSYAAAVTAALAKRPQLIYVITYYPEAAAIAKDLTGAGNTTQCMIDYGGFDNGYITDAGTQTAQRCTVIGVPSPSDFPNSQTLVSAFTKKFSTAPGSWSPYTYDSVLVLADAIGRAKSADKAKLTTALQQTSGWKGWTGTVAFESPSGNRTPAPVTLNSVTSAGAFTVDQKWIQATGFSY